LNIFVRDGIKLGDPMKNIYLQIAEYSERLSPLVIATVIFTRGSAPQKAGNSALFNKNGLIGGTIGGGVLEGRVEKIAREAAVTGYSGIEHFELDKSIEHKSEAICGGQVSVLIESGIEKYNSLFRNIDHCLDRRKRCVVVTVIKGILAGSPVIDRFVVSDGNSEDLTEELRQKAGSVIDRLLGDMPGEVFSSVQESEPGKDADELILMEAISPQPMLIIAGAGHIGRALHHLGRFLGFEVTVIDYRPEFANKENLPEANRIIVKGIGEAISDSGLSADTYVVIVTRGHNDDASALRACIGSKARYIGMIGSKTKIEKMRRNFLENGWATEKEWKAIHAPIGLDINSKTVEEIAVSIAAELVLVRNS